MPGYGYGISQVLTSTKSATTGGSPFEYTPIDNNYSMEFDGISDYITVPSFTTSGDDLTISLWLEAVNLSGASPSTTGTFVYGDANNFIYYNLNEVIYAKVNGNTSILVANSGGVPQIFGTGNWHHLAITKSGSTLTWWIDGVSYADLGTSGTGGFTMNTIGSATAGAYYFLDGNLDEVAVWDKSLSGSTIEAIYNTTNDSDTGQVADLSETPEGAPVAWYRFE